MENLLLNILAQEKPLDKQKLTKVVSLNVVIEKSITILLEDSCGNMKMRK